LFEKKGKKNIKKKKKKSKKYKRDHNPFDIYEGIPDVESFKAYQEYVEEESKKSPTDLSIEDAEEISEHHEQQKFKAEKVFDKTVDDGVRFFRYTSPICALQDLMSGKKY
jgi:hypothetical protein